MSSPPADQPPAAVVLTLGCKVNQYESAAISEMLVRAGYRLVPADQKADLCVINTCTVTHRADLEVRQIARRMHRRNPEVRTAVTGCLAQLRPREMAELPGVALVAGQDAKSDIVRLLEQPPGEKIIVDPPGRRILDLGAPDFGRTRAFFRIQDGCSTVCTYCTVPAARGPSRSLPADLVRQGLSQYVAAGYAEVVLTGIHLGAWGLDFSPPESLEGLLKNLAQSPPACRLRLSSVEPNEVSPLLLETVRGGGVFCPHLHLPLQSGSDRVLAEMNRPYTAALFEDLVRRAAAGRPDFCIGADVMVGFPGETEDDFEMTGELIRSLPLSYLHVFPYSPRPGTPAGMRSDHVDPADKKRRTAALRRLDAQKRKAFRRQAAGGVRPTLIENTPDPGTGLARGLTDNYLRVLLEGPTPPAGCTAPVRLTGLHESGVMSGRVED